MNKSLSIVLFFFLLFSFNCATTEQEVSKTEETAQSAEKAKETKVGDFDLTGDWTSTEDVRPGVDCGNPRTQTYNLEITQKGDMITIVNTERNSTSIGKVYNDTIIVTGSQRTTKGQTGNTGTVKWTDFKLKVSEDAKNLTGVVKWEWHPSDASNPCFGITNMTAMRK